MATSWTDSPVVADTTDVKAVHITELRTAIDNECIRRSGFAFSWAETITAESVEIKESHMTELRTNAFATHNTDCATDYTAHPTWTDVPLVQYTTLCKAQHINELRTYVNALEAVSCLCDGYCANNCNWSCGNNGQCNDN